MTESRADYHTTSGEERIFVTTILNGPLFERLERWRFGLPRRSGIPGDKGHPSRSEALRTLLDQHLPQLPSITNVSDS